MKPIKLKIETKTQKYPIIIGSNLITDFSKIVNKNSLTFNIIFTLKKYLQLLDINITYL